MAATSGDAMDLDIQPLTPERLPDLATLFEQGGDPKWCWCASFRLRSLDFTKANPVDNRAVLDPAVDPMPAMLETERLTLRGWRAGDADWHTRLVLERGAGPAEPGYSLGVVERQHGSRMREGFGLYVIERRADGDPIGYCGLTVGRASIAEPELAYELFAQMHGLGYATEAARAVVDAAAASGRTLLWSTVRAANVPSLRVLEKLGFRRDRVERDDRGELVWNVLDLRCARRDPTRGAR